MPRVSETTELDLIGASWLVGRAGAGGWVRGAPFQRPALGLTHRCFFLFLINISDFLLSQSPHLPRILFSPRRSGHLWKQPYVKEQDTVPVLWSHGLPPGGAFFFYDWVSHPERGHGH